MMTHKPVKYIVKRKGSSRRQPNTVLLRTDNLEEARRTMSANQQGNEVDAFYIDYTEEGLKEFAKLPRPKKRKMYNNANMPGIQFSLKQDAKARANAHVKNRRH